MRPEPALPEPGPTSPDRTPLEAAALGLACLVLYLLGACRTVFVGDSGELTTAVELLGIPHPPGYPLYVMLGKLFTLAVPIGSPAYRMSLFSAVAGAVAVSVLYLAARRSAVSRPGSLLSASLLAVAPSFWQEATIQRVYTLNALSLATAIHFGFCWHRTRRERDLLLGLVACSVGAGNHTAMAVAGAALAASSLLVDPRAWLCPRVVWKRLIALVSGAPLYLFLPLRSRHNPALDWGDPETLSNFLDVVLRQGFWERRYVETASDLWTVGWDWLTSFGPELHFVGTALALAGLVATWRKRGPALLLALVMLTNVASLALHGSQADLFIWHRYYLPSYLAAALLAGFGLDAVLSGRFSKLRPLALAVPLVGLVLGSHEADRSRYRIGEHFSRLLLDQLPPGARLAASDDNILFVLIYLHHALGLRPDLDLLQQGVGKADLPQLSFDPDVDPLFMTHDPNWRIEGLSMVPVGLVFRSVRAGMPLPELPALPEELEGESDPAVPKEYLTRCLIGHYHFMLGMSLEQRDWTQASAQFARAEAEAYDHDVLLYNLGLLYRRNGLWEQAQAAFERCREINPRRLAGKSGAVAADRLKELATERDQALAVEQAIAPSLAFLGEGSVGWHLAMAQLLADQGLPRAARGHQLQAELTSAR